MISTIKHMVRRIILEELTRSNRKLNRLTEGVGRNIPRIEKLVDEINALIAKDTEFEGVIDSTSTWEEPYIYDPIVYKNGRLKIVSRPMYSNKKDVEVIGIGQMEMDGIPTLLNIRKQYKAMLKKKY